MKFGVITFPGSNCDEDAVHVAGAVFGQPTVRLWHKDTSVQGCDVIIVPGGFSYGDYLRCGAMARFSPIMETVVAHAKRGGVVLGICNGFQILTEAGLLPGALLRNASLQFQCESVEVSVESTATPFTKKLQKGELLQLPIAHAEGNYTLDDDGLKRLEDNGQVVFRYRKNPNGSRNDIAGVRNEAGNVVGLMPHPERAAEALVGGVDGRKLFESLLA
ncbi:MAG: phosphoribosylformylglycinamidine synthase subunit PurQ [Archangium sp.]|nr:phosphoribosylformylglycinamidine synthase subunit PurQ [Archangium sp.]